MSILKGLNLTVSFLAELVALVIFGAWGFTIGETTPVKILLGIGAPALMIVFWALYMAPRAKQRLQDPWHLLFEIVIYGASQSWAQRSGACLGYCDRDQYSSVISPRTTTAARRTITPPPALSIA